LIVVVTSDRGLCGAFNTNIVKATLLMIEQKYAQQAAKGNVEIFAIGKKGAESLAKRGFVVNKTYMDIFGRLNFVNVKLAAEEIMKAFSDGRYDAVDLVYNEFKNVATQIIHTDRYLPIATEDKTKRTKKAEVNYIFEPTEEEILAELIPKSLKIQLYRAVLESNASEQGARMTAMDKATENAQDLLKELKLVYNRTRQAAITKEILEIVGGAEALKN
jgi:F-type H+-transporting ATPase subunit gamma